METLTPILFIVFGLTALGAAILMTTRRNPLHAAWFLALAGLGAAGLLLTLGATILATIHLLACGCAMILLSRKGAALARQATFADKSPLLPHWWLAALTAATLSGVLIWAAFDSQPVASASAVPLSLADLTFLAAIAVALLATATAGAVMITRKR